MSSSHPLHPLERLQVTDGLLLTADRWQIAHGYHRQRQNLHFQALGQAGIVQGLGVCPMTAPAHVPAQYRDQRWVQVQPGLAIDADGNPIVVPQPFDYRLTATPIQEPLQVYLVIRYVDPDQLESQRSADILKETFRVEEKVTPPDESEIELCRLHLQPGPVQVRVPLDCFAPRANEIDLRHRLRVCDRTQGRVRLGQLSLTTPADPRVTHSLNALQQSLAGLYPTLTGAGHPGAVVLRAEQDAPALRQALSTYDLLQVSYSDAVAWQPPEIDLLREYLGTGGVLLVELDAISNALKELLQVQTDLGQALASASSSPSTQAVQQALEAELTELEGCIQQEIQPVAAPLQGLVDPGQPAGTVTPIAADHALRTTPFWFAQWPTLNQTPLMVWAAGGLVLVAGSLSAGWGAPSSWALDRESIRSAQELGINLLHFAWQRRQLNQLLRAVPPIPIDALPSLSPVQVAPPNTFLEPPRG